MKGIRPRGPRATGESTSRARQASKPQRQPYRGRHSNHADTSPSVVRKVPIVPPTVQVLNRAPLDVFVQWNEIAMEALRNGDTDSSRRILAALLPVLEARLHAMQCKPTGHTSAAAIDSWRLAHVLTLNNDGCQLRRDGRVDEALRQFMRAKQVETLVFGQPSCSTMLNLSAVLLSSGAAEEALAISKECVMAAQDAEPVLFITALHNLAVALGQQSSERERNAALPTMRQALREAESALGEEHPTTIMLREKCVLTTQGSPLDAASNEKTNTAEGGAESGVGDETLAESPAPQPLPPKPPSARERARAALYTLDFGEPAHLKNMAEDSAPPDASRVPGSRPQSAGRKGQVLTASRSSVTSGVTLGERRQTGQWSGDLDQHRSSVYLSPQMHSVGDAREHAAHAWEDIGRTPSSNQAQLSGRLSSDAATIDQQCAGSVHLGSDRMSLIRSPLETVLQEPFRVESLVIGRSVPNCVGPAGPIRDLYETGSEEGGGGPSFLRFSLPSSSHPAHTAPLPLRKITESPVVPQPWNATVDDRRMKLLQSSVPGYTNASYGRGARSKEAATLPILSTAPPADELHTTEKSSASVLVPGGPVGQLLGLQRSLFGKNGPLSSKAEIRREMERQEELTYRAEKEAERRAEEARNVFQRELAKIQFRTKTRAAVIIQKAWRQWWNTVGRSRRQLQLHRMKEMQRRRRERQALGVLATKLQGKSGKGGIPPRPSQQHGEIGGCVVPAVVLRCAKIWLTKTVCVRYLAKSRRRAVDADLREGRMRRYLSRIQALWRGALVRRKRSQLFEQLITGSTQKATVCETNTRRAAAELRDYAALVLQMAYRSYRARCALRAAYLRRYTGPTEQIQIWFRATLASQRHRGVDSRTVRQRNAAALTIQRVWRGFLGRVAYRIRELRLRMNRVGFCRLALEADIHAEANAPAIGSHKIEEATPIFGNTSTPLKSNREKTARLSSRQATEVHAASSDRVTLELQSREVTGDPYSRSCLQRSSEVQRLRDAERDRYHIGLFVETMATKERQAWQESLRLRPSEVLRRRVVLDAQVNEEQRVFTERRAAVAIQRAYRHWQKMRRDPKRDTNMLYYSRAFYQQRQLGSLVQKKERRREIDRVTARLGDSIAPMREERQKAAELLALAEGCNGPASCSSGMNGVIAVPREDGRAVAPYTERMDRKQRRQRQEAIQRRDELLVAINHPHDMMHLRESPEECVVRTGKTYEHPYYIPYVDDEHRRILGID